MSDNTKIGECRNCLTDDVEVSVNNENYQLDGLCDDCLESVRDELDTSPTQKECDNDDNPAAVNICGQNLCEDCYEQMIGGWLIVFSLKRAF